MVSTPVDPIRIPAITLSDSEISEIKAQIKSGEIPSNFLELAAALRLPTL